MYILGISCYYHDSSATLLKNGKIVAAAQEERFTRLKHDTSFPKNAINYCLEKENISFDDIDYVSFYEKPIVKFERVLNQSINGFPKTINIFLKSIPSWFVEKLRVPKKLKKEFNYDRDIFFIDHHMSHAAGSFLISPYKKSAIVTVDGVGEWTTTAYGVGEKNNIKLLKEINFPHSIGLLYSTITAYLGFRVNNSEYKVMGLSSYGLMNRDKNNYYKKLKKVIFIKKDGSFSLDMSYFSYHYRNKMPSSKLCKLLDGSIRKKDSKLTKKDKDIAAALQMIYEDVLFNLLNYVQKETNLKNLVLGGGTALNSVANGKILKNTNFDNLWIPPAPGDGGTSLGSAIFTYNCILNNERNYVFENPYLGPSYSNEEIKTFLDKYKINYEIIEDDQKLIEKTANLIFENKIIGWFQGGMEWGPRALGSRSILANPLNKKMKDILNEKVKHREYFRPFAPVICKEDTTKFFKSDYPTPKPTDYMLMVYPIKEKWHDLIPSVTHINGTGRLQTISYDQNKKYYKLIKEFEKLSDVPILINTSFNIRGEPIVCSPYDAYKCMMGTGIDVMVIGNFIVYQKDNQKHLWESN